jgi:hypothetical protein
VSAGRGISEIKPSVSGPRTIIARSLQAGINDALAIVCGNFYAFTVSPVTSWTFPEIPINEVMNSPCFCFVAICYISLQAGEERSVINVVFSLREAEIVTNLPPQT